jgi:hypothetical protein
MFFRQCNNEEEKREDDLLNAVVIQNKVIVHCKKTKIILGTFFFRVATVQGSVPASSNTVLNIVNGYPGQNGILVIFTVIFFCNKVRAYSTF